ncbi:diguanylate cyclase domain-containing protein [Methylotenera sp.]|uniref:diguanylate cyclase domain-containing protein n=1 Tax=Methylotenera sp. TaxID=2051956 RepID=UPI002EDA9E1C
MSWVFFSAQSLLVLSDRKVKVADTRYEVVKLMNTIVNAETGLRGYLLTGSVQFLEPYNRAAKDTALIFSQIKSREKNFAEFPPILITLDKLIKEKFSAIESTLQVQLTAGSYSPHLKFSTGASNVLTDEIANEVNKLDKILRDENDRIEVTLSLTINRLKLASLVVVFLIISILLVNYKRTISLFEHASSSQELAEEFGYLAMHDALTHLPNRRNFEQYLKKSISQTGRSKQKIGLLYMDLDGFKLINDQYGHDAGDDALIGAVVKISHVLRDSDFIARVGGDEFALVAHNFNDADELLILANRIINALKEPVISIAGNDIFMGVSIGVAIYPDQVKSIKSLISAADEAMYKAKSTGKNQAVLH